jgi:RHS repeat-associated protein
VKPARPEPFFLSLRRPASSALGRLLAHALIAALVFALGPPRAEASIPRGPLPDPRPLADLAPAAARPTACLVVVVIVVADPIWLTKTAFGELLAHTGSDLQPYAFTGELYDPNVGFQYHRARWMDPRTGRFASVDPFEGRIFDPPTLHKYLYAGADPVNKIDPSGRELTVGQLAVVGAMIGALSAISIVQPRSALETAKVGLVGALIGALVLGGLAYWALGGSLAGAAATTTGGAATAAAVAGPRIIESEALVAGQLALPQAANRLWLGHWGYNGFRMGSQVFSGISQAGRQYLDAMANMFGGRTLSGYPANFDLIRREIDAADQIVFNVTRLQPYMQGGNPTLTWLEIQYITANPDLYAKTIFIMGGTF